MDAYTALAPAYDAMTASYDYERWLTTIERIASRLRPRGSRVLDLACGTGSSFLPLCDRGYDVSACDASAAMLSRARSRLGRRRARLFQADMRRVPTVGSFDLVLCLDDSVNHLLSGEDVSSTFAHVRANLAPDGVFVFDVNTLRAMRQVFSSDWRHDDGDVAVDWRGRSPADLAPGEGAAARVEVRQRADGARHAATLRECHHPLTEVVERLAGAGLRPAAVFAQEEGVNLQPDPDELLHRKALFFAVRSDVDAPAR